MKMIIPVKHFREKRTFINIFEWMKPDEILLKLGRCCKKFQMMTWNDELLNKMAFNNFGTKGLNEIKFRVARRLQQVATGQLPMVNGKEKERWMIETETSSESSGFWTSHDEEDHHIRKDANSSAEEENTLKDFLRRNAREERDNEKKAKERENQREIDMKVIERLRHENLPIPDKFKQMYGEDLTEANFNIPHTVANFNDRDGKEKDKISKEQFAKLTKSDKVRLQLLKQKKANEDKRETFIKDWIPEEDFVFKRKLMLFVSLRKRCFNCGYFENKLDMDSMLVICPLLKKPICHACKHSDAFKMTSATSASRKFKVDKKDIDMLNLPYIDAPNPYYHALKMKLYYEFMIVENLPKVAAWRKFKKEKQQNLLKEHRTMVRDAKSDAKRSKCFFALEIEFGRRGVEYKREYIMKHYVENPYMQRFLDNKINKNLAEVVDAIDNNEADELEEQATKKSVDGREKKYAKHIGAKSFMKTRFKSKSDKRDKKDKKQKKSKGIHSKQFRNASSSSTDDDSKPNKKFKGIDPKVPKMREKEKPI